MIKFKKFLSNVNLQRALVELVSVLTELLFFRPTRRSRRKNKDKD